MTKNRRRNKKTSYKNKMIKRASIIFGPKIATFSQFQVYLNVTQAKQMINSLLLNNFDPVISTTWKRKQRIVVYGLVTRYGPQSVASARQLIGPRTITKWLTLTSFLVTKLLVVLHKKKKKLKIISISWKTRRTWKIVYPLVCRSW